MVGELADQAPPYSEIAEVSVWCVDYYLWCFMNISEANAARLAADFPDHIYFFAELSTLVGGRDDNN